MGNETLPDYVLVSQDKPFVEHFSKHADGNWLYSSYAEITETIRIESIDCAFNLREIYERVEFEAIEEDLVETRREGR